MQEIFDRMIEKAGELLENGTVDRVLGWKAGEFFYDPTPAVFGSKNELSDFVYSGFCGANLSKYLINERTAGLPFSSSPATHTALTSF